MAFKIAGSMAFQAAAKKAKPVLLEPMMRVEVVVPKEHMGDVMGNLSSRRGQIQSQEDRGGTQIINARVPLSEMFGYSTDLRSRTQGRATYSMHFDRYEQAPNATSEEVIARGVRSEEHTSELQSHSDLVCRLLLEKKKNTTINNLTILHTQAL